MKNPIAVGVLAMAVMAGQVGCATSTHAHKEMVPFSKTHEIQCEVSGFHTLASETPDYLGALRGLGEPIGIRSVLAAAD